MGSGTTRIRRGLTRLLASGMALGAATVATLVPGASHAESISTWPIVSAHYGGFPANSIAGITNTLALKLPKVELDMDVQRTDSGTLVFHHDDTLPAACTSTDPTAPRTIHTMTDAQLATFTCSNQPIPNLAQVIAIAVKNPSVQLALEMKRYDGQSATSLSTATKQATTAIVKAGLASRTVVKSFSWTTVIPASRSVSRSVRTAAQDNTPSIADVRKADSLGASQYHGPAFLVTPYQTRLVKALGMRIHLWGTDNETRYRYAIDAYTTHITTDRPAATRDHLAQYTNVDPVDPRSVAIQDKRLVPTLITPVTISNTRYATKVKQYPVVVPTALPTAPERLMSVELKVTITKGDGLGTLRFAPSGSWSASEVGITMPKGSKTATISVPVGDAGKIRVYASAENVLVKIEVVGYTVVEY